MLGKKYMTEQSQEFIATGISVVDGMVHLTLSDGSTHAFPVHYYPRLVNATPAELNEVVLRVGGRALRWENLDEDIWVGDAICQKYPNLLLPSVAEDAQLYKS